MRLSLVEPASAPGGTREGARGGARGGPPKHRPSGNPRPHLPRAPCEAPGVGSGRLPPPAGLSCVQTPGWRGRTLRRRLEWSRREPVGGKRRGRSQTGDILHESREWGVLISPVAHLITYETHDSDPPPHDSSPGRSRKIISSPSLRVSLEE